MIVEFSVKEWSEGYVTVEVPDDASDEEIMEAAKEQVELGNAVYGVEEYKIDEKSKRIYENHSTDTPANENTSEKETEEIMKEYWDKEYYSIEKYPDGKYIHFMGYIYDEGCDSGEGKTSRNVEYSGFIVPLEEYLKWNKHDYKDEFYKHLERCNGYMEDMTPKDAIYAMNHYYDGKPPIELSLKKVTMETPCGDYVDEYGVFLTH